MAPSTSAYGCRASSRSSEHLPRGREAVAREVVRHGRGQRGEQPQHLGDVVGQLARGASRRPAAAPSAAPGAAPAPARRRRAGRRRTGCKRARGRTPTVYASSAATHRRPTPRTGRAASRRRAGGASAAAQRRSRRRPRAGVAPQLGRGAAGVRGRRAWRPLERPDRAPGSAAGSAAASPAAATTRSSRPRARREAVDLGRLSCASRPRARGTPRRPRAPRRRRPSRRDARAAARRASGSTSATGASFPGAEEAGRGSAAGAAPSRRSRRSRRRVAPRPPCSAISRQERRHVEQHRQRPVLGVERQREPPLLDERLAPASGARPRSRLGDAVRVAASRSPRVARVEQELALRLDELLVPARGRSWMRSAS